MLVYILNNLLLYCVLTCFRPGFPGSVDRHLDRFGIGGDLGRAGGNRDGQGEALSWNRGRLVKHLSNSSTYSLLGLQEHRDTWKCIRLAAPGITDSTQTFINVLSLWNYFFKKGSN